MLDGTTTATATSRSIGWLMVLQVASELLFVYSESQGAEVVSKALVVCLPLLAWRAMRLREGYLLGVCFVLVVLTWGLGKAVGPIVALGLSRAGYLASFILLMALLREGALLSRSVLEVGTFLTRQPPKRRFLTLFAGGHLFAVLINLGALSLLAPIIQRGVRAAIPDGQAPDDISQVRERRQLSAAFRGFSWILVWAPTSVTQAVMPTLLSGVDANRLIVTGLGIVLVMLGIGWVEDILRWRGFRKQLEAEGRLPLATATRVPLRSARRLGLVCLALFGLTATFAALGGVSVVSGAMLAAPLVVASWIVAQERRGGGARPVAATAARLRAIAFESLPGYAREAVFIACAGFIGTLAANLVLAADLAGMAALASQPGWLILWVLSASVWIFGQVGLSPITMAVFLGSVVAEMPGLPVDATQAALAIAAGTAVCTTGAPFSSGAVMLARATGYPSTTLTWRWNGPYTLAVLAVLAIIYGIMTR